MWHRAWSEAKHRMTQSAARSEGLPETQPALIHLIDSRLKPKYFTTCSEDVVGSGRSGTNEARTYTT